MSLALAASLEVQVAYGPDGPVVVDSRVVDGGDAVASPTSSAHRLEALDADGRVLATAPVRDPRHRSIVLPDGSHGASAHLVEARTVVRLPWPDGARRLRLDDGVAQPPSPLPVTTGTLAAERLIGDGPSTARLDLVVLGDGYTAAELDTFAADTDRIVDYLLDIEPYGAYAGLFNVWRIDRASAESGATHRGADPIERDTAYGCYYGCSGLDRLVCCDDGAVLGDVLATVPGADGVLVLVNDPTYGGSGGFTYATSYVGDPYGPQVAAHELGHTLVGLWDEYGYGLDGPGEGPNCSVDPAGAWDSWVGTDGVGAYPECSYNGLHRPTLEGCMMRTLQDDYCPVCRQEVVLAMYGGIDTLVEAVVPPPGPVDHPPPGFAVTLSVPEAPVEVEWRLDGQLLHTGAELQTECFDADGELVAVVRDPTPWVRDDPDGRLQEEAGRWQVTAGPCPVPNPDPPGSPSTSDEGTSPSPAFTVQPTSPCSCQGGPSGSLWWAVPLLLWFRRQQSGTTG